MAGQRGRHALRTELASARAQYPGDGKSRESSHGLNRACASGIDEAELREPSATPNPMREQRIRRGSKQGGGSAARSQAPAVGAAAQGNDGRETRAQQPEQRGQRRSAAGL